MRIGTLQLQNFGSYRSSTFTFDAPITLLYSPNNCGKSNAVEALAWCLTGLCRGTDRRGAGLDLVISEGADTMKVGVSLRTEPAGDALTVVRAVKDRSTALLINGGAGKIADQQAKLNAALGFSEDIVAALLNSRAFLDLAHADAKAVLLQVLDVTVTVDGEALRLAQLEAKYQEAFDQRRVKKAELAGVRVPEPPADEAPDLAGLEDQLQTLRDAEKLRLAAIAQDDGRRGAIEREHQRACNDLMLVDQSIEKAQDLTLDISSREARLAQLEPSEGHETRLRQHRSKLAAADGRLPMLQRTVTQIETHDPKKGCVLDAGIPCKTAASHFSGQVARLEQEVTTLKVDKDLASEALTAERQRTAEVERLEKELKGLRDRQAARAQLLTRHDELRTTSDRLFDEIAGLPPAAAQDPELAALQARIARGQQTITEARAVVEAWRRHEDAKARQAALAKQVHTLEQRVELLGPKGARVQALEAAVSIFESAINGALQRFGYRLQFSIDPWDVRVNGRSAIRLSESERLRVGLCLQLALAEVTGLGLVVIDGADLLDARNRGLLVEVLSQFEGQCVVTATRDEPPPPMDGVAVYWLTLERGVTHVERIGAPVTA